ncbi:tyrosine-type recombinase/integrase [Streptomyces sp. NPDC059618]|uniref:tyrosine-type recombinase/integrase n=1 Tax=Streptomyces sp. NPDC059618 TaxID=3346887 RepID=UPI00368D3C29
MIDRKRKKKKRTNTVNNYEGILRNHILPYAGDRAAASLRRRDSMALIDHLLEKPSLNSPRSVIQVFKTWRLLMHYMIDEDVPLPANIVTRIELPDVDIRRADVLTPGQVAAVAAAIAEIEPRFEILVWLAACAGLRAGEALGLRRDHVDWMKHRLHIQEQRQRGQAAPLKRTSSYATLPIDRFLIERLTLHVDRFPGAHQDSAARRGVDAETELADEGLIVTTRSGRPVSGNDLSQKWRQAADRADLPEGSRFHQLKSFYTSTLGGSGGHDPKTVQSLSRHARFSETWDTYARPPLAVESLTVTIFSSTFPDPPGRGT